MNWQECLMAVDQAIEDLKNLMRQFPAHGAFYQERIVIMMLRKQLIVAKAGEN